jgi:hypothetical protein
MAESLVAAVDSSWIDEVFYNAVLGELTLTLLTGARYTYSGVPPDVAAALVAAPSKGRYVNAVIKRRYSYRKG